MKRYCLLLLVPALLLAGCGSLGESKKIEYKSAGKLPPLEIPPDLTTPSRDDRYAVPESAKSATTFSSYAGERSGEKRVVSGSEVLPQLEGMRVERSGTQRWLVVRGTTPDRLWPEIKAFWQENGFIVNLESAQTGIMETDWAENRAKLPQDFIRSTLGKVLDSIYSTAERDKFRTRLEKAADGGTEIYISHRGMYEIYTTEGRSDTRWQPRPPEPELEAEMLSKLMLRLGVSEVQTKTLLAKETKTERATLSTADGNGVLRLDEPFDRAWRRVGLALDRVGFTVEDRDRNQGIYFVRYVDPEVDLSKKQSKGILDRLKFWKDNKPDVLANAQFRIQVKSQGEASAVTVLTREGGLDQSESSNKILGLLLNQLK